MIEHPYDVHPCAMCGERHTSFALTKMKGGAFVCDRCMLAMPDLKKWIKP
jgi:hypothetical protein